MHEYIDPRITHYTVEHIIYTCMSTPTHLNRKTVHVIFFFTCTSVNSSSTKLMSYNFSTAIKYSHLIVLIDIGDNGVKPIDPGGGGGGGVDCSMYMYM